MNHGTRSMYTNGRCRCSPCKQAAREYNVRYWAESDKEVAREQKRLWHIANKERLQARRSDPEFREALQAKRHGLTVEQLRVLKESGTCAICGASEPGGSGVWHIDHDHSCCPSPNGSCGRCIRGVLCFCCNIGLGYFQDDPIILEAAIRYLCRKYEGVRLAEYMREIES